MRREAAIPALIRQCMLESESQLVNSLAVPPTRGIALSAIAPRFEPIMVTTAEPVANLFVLNKLLIKAE